MNLNKILESEMKRIRSRNPKTENTFTPSHLIGLELVGYVQGDKVIKGSATLELFDSVTIIGASPNQIDGKDFIHATGRFNQFTYFLILKK